MIYAENDVILPEVNDFFSRLKTTRPSSALHAIPEYGHFLQEDRPEEVLKPMLAFYQHFRAKKVRKLF
ncbi:MAG: pimeloyl-ACP methyl ester carboxylesterase [Oleiphilaceae bacterium]|jgi:pimeloyl-ACP methyl ester carboxylesterase